MHIEIEKWEEQFDKRFNFNHIFGQNSGASKELKVFIAETIEGVRKEEKKNLFKWVGTYVWENSKEYKDDDNALARENKAGWNTALSTLYETFLDVVSPTEKK